MFNCGRPPFDLSESAAAFANHARSDNHPIRAHR